MRLLKFALAALAATVALGTAQAEPVKIRAAWVAPVSNWAVDRAGEEGPRQASRQVLHAGGRPLRRHAADDHRARQRRAGNRQPRLLDVPAGGAERQPRRPADHRRRVPGRRQRLPQQRVLCAGKDSPIKKVEDLKGKVIATNSIGSAVDIGSRAMLQEARPGGQARLHHRRGAVPHHEGDAEGEEGRPRSVGAAVQLRSRSSSRCRASLFTSKDAIGVSQFIVWAARKSFIDKNRAAMVDFMEDMLRHRALVHGPEEPGRGDADRVEGHQGAAGAVRLAVHQAGLLPQSRHAAEPRRAAIQHQHRRTSSASSRRRST